MYNRNKWNQVAFFKIVPINYWGLPVIYTMFAVFYITASSLVTWIRVLHNELI